MIFVFIFLVVFIIFALISLSPFMLNDNADIHMRGDENVSKADWDQGWTDCTKQITNGNTEHPERF